METTINMPQSDVLSSGDKFVQDLRDDPNIPPNLLQTAINNVRSGNNVMQSAQTTPASSSLPFDHKGPSIESSHNDPNQSHKSSNNQPQHPPSTLELKRLKAELEERHIINTESIKQNLSMQHPTSVPSLSHHQHTHSVTHQHTQDMFNQSINNNLIGVLYKVEKSMVQQNNVLHESLRQSVTASKEHYLSNAKPCDGKITLDLSTWLEDVSRISTISCKDPESVALTTSRGSLHKYVRELHSLGTHWSAMKLLLQERFLEYGNSTMAKHRLTTTKQTNLAMHEYISNFSDLVEHTYTLTPTDPASMILATDFTNGIKNPHIKKKLRSCKISNLQDIFKFALEEDQKQKISTLDFEAKPDTIAHCDIQTIMCNNCYKCGNEGHFIKDFPSSKIMPHIIKIPHLIINSHMQPTVGQIAVTQICLHPSHQL